MVAVGEHAARQGRDELFVLANALELKRGAAAERPGDALLLQEGQFRHGGDAEEVELSGRNLRSSPADQGFARQLRRRARRKLRGASSWRACGDGAINSGVEMTELADGLKTRRNGWSSTTGSVVRKEKRSRPGRAPNNKPHRATIAPYSGCPPELILARPASAVPRVPTTANMESHSHSRVRPLVPAPPQADHRTTQQPSAPDRANKRIPSLHPFPSLARKIPSHPDSPRRVPALVARSRSARRQIHPSDGDPGCVAPHSAEPEPSTSPTARRIASRKGLGRASKRRRVPASSPMRTLARRTHDDWCGTAR